jgi:cell wall-associated NlpC family hydrolase
MDDPHTDNRHWSRRWCERQASAASILLLVLATAVTAALPTSATAAPTPPAANATPGPAPTSLADLRAQAAAVRSQINLLDVQAEVTIEQYDAARAALDTVSGHLATARMQLGTAQNQLAGEQAVLAQRAASMYKTGSLSLLDVLLSTGDFTDLETQIHFYRYLSEEDAANVKRVQDLVASVTLLNQHIGEDQARARALTADLSIKTAIIGDKLAERQSVFANLDAAIKKVVTQRQAADQSTTAALTRQTRLLMASLPGTTTQLAGVRKAMDYLGVPYVWGGATPAGFDCSGLSLYVYSQFGVQLPHAATLQARLGTPVPLDQLQPADLVFFGDPSFYHHVGIYIGNGLFIEAPHTGDVVKISRLAGRGATLACRYALHL